MSVVSELVMATREQAQGVAQSTCALEQWSGVDIAGIDPIKLCTLQSILTEETFEELLGLYTPLVSISNQGPWVCPLPGDLVRALAQLDATELEQTAEQWAATDEFQADDWSTPHVLTVLESMALLARQALEAKRLLFLRMSL